MEEENGLHLCFLTEYSLYHNIDVPASIFVDFVSCPGG